MDFNPIDAIKFERELPDGRYAYVEAMTYGKGRIQISPSKENKYISIGF